MIFPRPKGVNEFPRAPARGWDVAEINAPHTGDAEKGVENTLRLVLK
jgi:hypothetical protein